MRLRRLVPWSGLVLVVLAAVGCASTAKPASVVVPARTLPEDALLIMPGEVLGVVRATPAAFASPAAQQLGASIVARITGTAATTGFLGYVVAQVEEITLGFDFQGNGSPALVAVMTGDFHDWRDKLRPESWHRDARGAFVVESGTPDVTTLFLDQRHFIAITPRMYEALFATLDDPRRAFLNRDSVAGLAKVEGFRTASAAVLVASSPAYVERMRGAAADLEEALPLLEQLEGLVVTLQLTEAAEVSGTLRTRGEVIAKFIGQVLQVMQNKLPVDDTSPLTRALRATVIVQHGADVAARWTGGVPELQATIDPWLTPDAAPAPVGDDPELAISAYRSALETAPEDKQVRANLGWALVRNGDIDAGLVELRQAPLAPSKRAAQMFPHATDIAQRRALRLRLLAKLSEHVDGQSIELVHTFVDHVVVKNEKDPELRAQLQALAARPEALVYAVALGSAFYDEDDFANSAITCNRIVDEIEKRAIQLDDIARSHFYLNAAYGNVQLGNLELAKSRLARAIQLNPRLYGWVLKEERFAPLRNAMGEASFKQTFEPHAAQP